MGYLSFIEKTTSNKIVLVEIDVGSDQTDWLNYTAGVWAYTWSSIYYDFAIGDGAIGSNPLGYGNKRNFVKIDQVFVEGELYDKKTNLNDVINNEKSWYFDNSVNRLYVHYDDNDEAQLYSTQIGIIMGLSNKAVYLDNLYYEPRLTGVPTIEKSKDLFYFGILRFDGGDIDFNNADGFFDSITDNYIFGQPVRIYHGGDDLSFSEYQKIYEGYVESLSMDYETFTISVIDNRKKLSANIIQNVFNKSDYSDLSDDDIGKPIPIIYGEVYHCEVICTNKAQSGTADWSFKVCDVSGHSNGIEDIVKAYKSNGTEVTIKSKDLTNGVFTIDNSNWDGKGEIYCDIKGLKDNSGNYLTNPLDIIKDILEVYEGIEYNSDNYDTTEWSNATSSDLANDIGLFINEDIRISDVIGNICNSVFGYFVVLDDGRYSFKIIDETASSETIITVQEMNVPINIEWDGTQFLSSCKVGYKKDYYNDEYRWYVNDNYETEIYYKYKKKYNKNFETLLINSTDAQELAEAIMNYYKDVRPVFSIATTQRVMLLDVGDIVTLEVDRVNKNIMGYVKAEIIGISKDLLNGIISLTCRYIEDVS